jgi:ribosomal protein S18 acetylase RimI-like enzyme
MTMRILDLRQVTPVQIDGLLREEARHWREKLHWDYGTAVDLIKRFLDARALAGCAAFENGELAGYSFYVVEEQKGLVGGLFVSPRYPQEEIGQRLLEEVLHSMRSIPHLLRIETQLMPFGGPVERTLRSQHFHLYRRQFMLLNLDGCSARNAAPVRGACVPERWNDRFLEPCARLIHQAYAAHVDGEINDQYRSHSGALRFLKNIILLPGCGQFLPRASFVLRKEDSEELLGVVLNSEVAPGVGHTTQICVLPGHQGQGLGRCLMQTSIQSLCAMKFHEATLTVTSSNEQAARLYESLGYRILKTFTAGVWPG